MKLSGRDCHVVSLLAMTDKGQETGKDGRTMKSMKERIADIIFNETLVFEVDMNWIKCEAISEKICEAVKKEIETIAEND